MKKLIIATGALFIGTSALAWQPSTEPVARDDKAPFAAAVGAKAAGTALVAKSNDLPKVEAKAEGDSASWLAGEGVEPKVELASATWAADGGLAGKEHGKEIDTSRGDPDLDLAEAPEPMALAAATPQPATGNYPACRPGPGDDNCIQLYEPGVRTALANWTQPTGGLAGDTRMAAAEADTRLGAEMGEATGVGGPYEPVDASADLAMNGDGAVDGSLGERAESEQFAAAPGEYTGMGGPIAETGYPPCSATVTDRCIQLYERGVTGEGN